MGFWRALALWAMIIYVAVIACATVFFRPVIGGALQLDPFAEWKAIFSGLAGGDPYIVRLYAVEIIINLFMLVPVGFLAPLAAGRRLNSVVALAVGAVISLIIEALQYLTGVGLFQTADLMHNSLGCVIGCIVGDAVWKHYIFDQRSKF